MSQDKGSVKGDLAIRFEGVETAVPFRAAIAKGSGNTYWAVMARNSAGDRYFSKYGVQIPALASALPTSAVVVDPATGETTPVVFQQGTTEDLRRKVSSTGKVTLPNGEVRLLDILVSETRAGGWNIKAVARGIGGGGGGNQRSLGDL